MGLYLSNGINKMHKIEPNEVVLAKVKYFFTGAIFGIFFLTIILTIFGINPLQVDKKWIREAISHGAAHYEVNTNGVVSLKWNR